MLVILPKIIICDSECQYPQVLFKHHVHPCRVEGVEVQLTLKLIIPRMTAIADFEKMNREEQMPQKEEKRQTAAWKKIQIKKVLIKIFQYHILNLCFFLPTFLYRTDISKTSNSPWAIGLGTTLIQWLPVETTRIHYWSRGSYHFPGKKKRKKKSSIPCVHYFKGG